MFGAFEVGQRLALSRETEASDGGAEGAEATLEPMCPYLAVRSGRDLHHRHRHRHRKGSEQQRDSVTVFSY